MNKDELFNLYEKLYFHEIENRDKITSRLQLPLAIFISIFSMLGFMVRNINYELNNSLLITYFILLTLSIIPVTIGIYYFIRGFFGHEYEYIPNALKTEEYNIKLHNTYKKFESGDNIAEGHLRDYLYRDYYECSSKNSEVNDNRSLFIHRSNFFIIVSILPLLITFLIFTFASVDKNNKEKIQKVSIETPLSINGTPQSLNIKIIENESTKEISKSFNDFSKEVKTMAEKDTAKTPPPPPPPPPKRLIREDVQIGGKKEKTNTEGDK